eukprot:COSAG04_NODE_38_length_33641_cov_13.222527_6_plen_55_part_00
MLRERAAATRNDGSVSDAAVEPLRVSAAYQLAEMVRIISPFESGSVGLGLLVAV